MFPELRNEPKERIKAALDADKDAQEQLTRLAVSNNFTTVAGILNFLSRAAQTLARAFVTGIGALLVARIARAPPPPVE